MEKELNKNVSASPIEINQNEITKNSSEKEKEGDDSLYKK